MVQLRRSALQLNPSPTRRAAGPRFSRNSEDLPAPIRAGKYERLAPPEQCKIDIVKYLRWPRTHPSPEAERRSMSGFRRKRCGGPTKCAGRIPSRRSSL